MCARLSLCINCIHAIITCLLVADLLEETEELRLWPTTTSSLCGDILLDTSRSHPSLVLAGSTHSFNSLRLVDLTSKDTIFLPQLPEKDDQSLCIHYCSFLPVADSSKQLVTCSGRGGQIDLWDWRVNPGQAVITLPPLANQFFQSPLAYSLAASGLGMTPSSSGSVQLARLAASGWLDLFDTRYPARVLASATCSGTSSSSSSCSSGGCGRQDFSAASTFTRFSQGGDHPLPCVKVIIYTIQPEILTVKTSGVDGRHAYGWCVCFVLVVLFGSFRLWSSIFIIKLSTFSAIH